MPAHTTAFYVAASLVAATLSASFAASAQTPPLKTVASSTAACPALLQHSFPRLQDEKPQALCQYSGKVLLVVNTASFCGFTPQYEGLEKLNARFADKGLVILGFPSNDFNQESADSKKIADLCFNTYGVKFPMFATSSVKGGNANALYQQLSQATGQAPAWNFHKYLVDRNGKPIANYGSNVAPLSPTLVAAIEQALATK